MERRHNLLFALPIGLGLLAFFASGNLLYTALGFIAGYFLMEGLRFLVLPPHLHRAVRLFQGGQMEEALALTDRSLRKRPDRWETHYLRSLIFFALSRLPDAVASARRAVSINPKSDASHARLGQALAADGHLNEARSALERAVALRDRDPGYHYHLGAVLFQLHEYGQAIPHLAIAVERGLDSPQLGLLASYYLGRALEHQGGDAEASAAYERMRQRAEALPELQQDLANAPDYPGLAALRHDVAAIAQRLGRSADLPRKATPNS
ncbi:MAG: tetratricopeptide repeat protein [Anaerolineae bacterium]|nr:tetratricopeptide repeat protein [Anaerolineae bacterium]